MTQTFELAPEQLPPDEVLTYAPGIYEEMVIKQFDIRMVLMGDRVYSFALHNPKKDIAAAVAASPYMSRETGRAG